MQGATCRIRQRLAYVEACRWEDIAPTVCPPADEEEDEPLNTDEVNQNIVKHLRASAHNLVEDTAVQTARYGGTKARNTCG